MSKFKRTGCKDIWNAFMCDGAKYTNGDIPVCPTTATQPPSDLILWDEAKALCKKNNQQGNTDFYFDAFVCFYMDDYKFDGPKGIWNDCDKALDVLKHFAGMITIDFSTYQDFPEPIKIYNTYRMRASGYWFGKNGISVINNVRWGTPESWKYCWAGIPKNSIVAIGTVGGNPKKLIDRNRFNEGFNEMLHVLSPHTIVIYGSSKYEAIEKAAESGINILSFQSRTARAYEGRFK